MYEDTPQDLVHDLVTEAVFGPHPLGRPVIGSAERDLERVPPLVATFHRAMYIPGNIVVAAAGNVEHERLVAASRAGGLQAHERRSAEAPRALAAGQDAPAGSPLPAQGHRAVPRLPGGARHRALRPAPLRRLAPGRHPRRLRLVALLPGDPREARDGLLRLHLRLAVHGHRADRLLRRHARGEPARLHRDRRRGDRRHRRRQPARERAGAREGEPEGTDHARDGVDRRAG